MLALGLVLLLLGLLALVTGLFTADDSADGASLLGIELGATTVFLVGVFAGVAILWGITITRFGTKRTLKHRRESKQLAQLSDKLNRVEAERAKDSDEDRPSI